MKLVSVDLGGTHARFALAEVADGRVVSLGEPVTLKTAEYASLQTAWEAFGQHVDAPLPRAAAIAVASPIGGELIKLTNNPWIIRPALIPERLGVDTFVLINDFGAIGHAVAQVGPQHFAHVCGPDTPLPDHGSITVCGPGTGLGVAQVLRTKGAYHVIETEGGHQDFAPLDAIEDALLNAPAHDLHARVGGARRRRAGGSSRSTRRSPRSKDVRFQQLDDKAIWALALEGSDRPRAGRA